MTATTHHGPHPLGGHPEAEQLSAFAERALPAHERDQVFAHLATCGRCRQIIALSARAEELDSHTLVAAAAAAPSLAATVARRHTTWWRNWHFAWIPVAALVATVSLVAYIHIVHIDRAAELARNNPPAVSRNETPPASPAPRSSPASPVSSTPTRQRTIVLQPSAKSWPYLPSAAVTAAPAPPEPKAAYAAAPPQLQTASAGAAAPSRMPLPEPKQAQLEPQPAQPQPPPPAATETVTVASDQAAPETVSAQQLGSLQSSLKAANSPLRGTPPPPAAPPAQAAAQASPASPQLQAERDKKFAEFNRQLETDEKIDSLSAARSNPQSASVGAAVSGANASTAAYSQPAASNSASIAAFGSLHGLSSSAGLAGTAIRLPSGLALASIASSGHLLLAIDNSGALFLTQDSAVTWRKVARQWSGRAVLVRTRNLANPRAVTAPVAAPDADPSSASPAPPAPSIVFEVVNEKNQVWQSADGLVWVPK